MNERYFPMFPGDVPERRDYDPQYEDEDWYQRQARRRSEDADALNDAQWLDDHRG